MKSLLVVAAGVLAGLAAAAIWTWAQPERHRADARVLVRPASARVVPAVAALAESSLVESNVAQTLRLASPPDVSASTGDGGVLTISVEAGSRELARQIDAEAVTILMQKVAQRFATTVGVTTTVLDPAHPAEQTSPSPGRNFLITGLIGLAAGLGLAARPTGRHKPAAGTVDPRVERRVRARIDEVTKRERALAKRAGELALRERALSEREDAAARRERRLEQTRGDGQPVKTDDEAGPQAAETTPVERPALPAQTQPEFDPSVGASATSGWTLAELEALVRGSAAAGADTAHQEECSMYLFFLRQHAAADGSLPRAFDHLIDDVFAPLGARKTD